MNTDIETYEFEDPDLEIAAGMLEEELRITLILSLMGFNQRQIGELRGVGRSAISRRFIRIKKQLRDVMLG